MKVYAELEATPDRGREFASAIRHLMQARIGSTARLVRCSRGGWEWLQLCVSVDGRNCGPCQTAALAA